MWKSGVTMVEGTNLDCTTSMRSIPITDLDSKRELQLTLFQLQQTELEFHDSKWSSWLSDEENPVALRREALNWRSACFWYSGQHREGVRQIRSASSRLISFAIVVFLCSQLLFVWYGYKKYRVVKSIFCLFFPFWKIVGLRKRLERHVGFSPSTDEFSQILTFFFWFVWSWEKPVPVF